MMRCIIVCLSMLLPLVLCAKEEPEYTNLSKGPSPWFTGPLLAPSGHVITKGHINVEPYFYWETKTGSYDSEGHAYSVPNFRTLLFQFPLWVGVTPWMDIQITPQASYQETQKHSSTRINDFPIRLDIQLLSDVPEVTWYPAIKFFIGESFPIGKYQHLNPHKLGTDVGGSGSFTTTAGFVLARLFHLGGIHFLATRLQLGYAYAAPVHVQGFNAYGGGYKTHGKVFPGQNPFAVLGLELSLSQNWVLAFDVYDTYNNKTRFKGNPGHLADGSIASVKSPSSNQLSLAPAIEYNWSSHLGVIGGVWLTVAGRNASRFINGVIALNYYQ